MWLQVKPAIVVLSAIFISLNSNADVYEDYASTNRKIFLTNICEGGAAHYKDYSMWVSDRFSVILQNSKPNSSERKSMLSVFNGLIEESDDEDFKRRKSAAKTIGEGNAARTELAYQALTLVRQIAYDSGVKQPGKSATFYQRTIEEECKFKAVK